MRSKVKPYFTSLACGICLFAGAAHAQKPNIVFKLPFDRIVTFGDSLSDPGNAYAASGEFLVPPFEDGAGDAPYAIGAFHFSNGPTWIEWLGREVRLFKSTRPALLRPGVYTNYAIGAARARDEFGPPNLGSEIDTFLNPENFDGSALPEALYVIWIGANDLFDALKFLPTDPITTGEIIQEALQATGEGIQALYDAGARSFLVLNLPDLAITPAVRAQGPAAEGAAEFFSTLYNAGLEQVLQGLEAVDDEIVIARMDVFAILNDAVANPASVGLTNVTDSCITPGVLTGALCSHPHTYLFWDDIHPTTQAHRLLGQDADTILTDTFGTSQSVAAAARPMISAH